MKVEMIHEEFEDIYKQLFQSAGEGLILCDHLGEIILANPSATVMFGYDENDTLVGKRIEELIPDHLKQRHQEHRERYVAHPSKRTMGAGLTLFAKKKNGSEFPVEISLNHLKRDEKIMVMAMITDTTRRWELDKIIRREKENAQQYLDVASAIFVVINKKEQIELLNRSGELLLGVTLEECRNLNWFNDFVHSEDRIKAKECFESAWKGLSDYSGNFEIRVKTKKKGERIISWVYSGVKDENGKVRAVLCSGQDITERIEAENKLKMYATELESRVEARTEELSKAVKGLEKANEVLEERNKEIIEAQKLLVESQKLYKIIARNFPKGTISVFDKNLNYIFVEGKELYEMGVTSEMLIGTNLLDRLMPEIRDETSEALLEVFNGKAKVIEIKQKDNIYILSAVPLSNFQGKVDQIMVVEQNVTESKNAEENIKNALKKERELGELKTRFVSMASHEFRTPLSTILSSISLVKKYLDLGGNADKIEKHILRIKSSVNNLTNILNDFLSLGKLEEGKVLVNIQNVNVVEFAGELKEEMQDHTKPGQYIEIHHLSDISDFRIDKNILRNILVNLLSNAIKYSENDNRIDFDIDINGTKLKISIRDYGMGIPLEEQPFMFERFFRAKNASNIQGTGLGLNIVKKYTDLLGGEISFSSKEKEGTIFTVIFDQNGIEELINQDNDQNTSY